MNKTLSRILFNISLCMCAITCINYKLLAMDSPFFEENSSSEISPKKLQKMLVGNQKFGPERYAQLLQYFANTLYAQDDLFVNLDLFLKWNQALKQAKDEYHLFIENNKQNISSHSEIDGVDLVGFTYNSRETHVFLLLLSKELNEKQQDTLSVFKNAIDSLSSVTNNELIFVRKYLQAWSKIIELTSSKTKQNLEESIDFFLKKEWILKFAEEYTDFSLLQLSLNLFSKENKSDDEQTLISLKEILDIYRQKRADYKNNYAAAIKELNRLLEEKSKYIKYGFLLESKNLLPGITQNVPPEASTSTMALPSIESIMDQDWAKSFDKPSYKSTEKKKGKEKQRNRQKKQTSHDFAKQEILSLEQPPTNQKETITKPQSHSQEEQIIAQENNFAATQFIDNVITYPIGNHELVRAWHLYKISYKNKVKFKFPLTYSGNVNDWFEDSSTTLKKQGYFDPSSYKYKKAFEFAKNRKEEYKNEEELHSYMTVYHTFPLEIDNHIKQFGRIEKKLVIDPKNSNWAERIIITMPGELELKDSIRRGLFSYIIDPETNKCYHRMFEPVNKNALDPSYYDIYFLSLE